MTNSPASPRTAPSSSGTGAWLYAAWFWSIGVPYLFIVGMTVTVLPGIERRRRFAGAAARGFFLVTGMRLRLSGIQHLPRGACVVVANHASYLDGIVLTAALPPDFSFVIKREAARIPLVGLMLRRLRSHFVDRFDRRAGSADAGRMIRAAQDGHPIGIFPEGTFIAAPGLRAFRRGAFIAACKAGIPVVPIAIRGSRQALGGGSWLPRRATIEFEFLPAIQPAGCTLTAATALSSAARAAILGACGEPDLTGN